MPAGEGFEPAHFNTLDRDELLQRVVRELKHAVAVDQVASNAKGDRRLMRLHCVIPARDVLSCKEMEAAHPTMSDPSSCSGAQNAHKRRMQWSGAKVNTSTP